MQSVAGKILSASVYAVLIFAVDAMAVDMRPQIAHSPAKFQIAKTLHNVVYGTADGIDLKMDIYVPFEARNKKVPAVVLIHGGSWRGGSKKGIAIPLLQPLIRHGYIVASVDYRLAPEFQFPAQIEDCKCAVRFLRAHTNLFHIDSNHIGAAGESAGGHLAALLGLAGTNAGFEGDGGWENESSRVQAVADLFGPTDLVDWQTNGHPEYIWTTEYVFGTVLDDNPILRRASPVDYVTSNAPPFFILHGDLDNVVPIGQSIELYEKLKSYGDSATILIVTNFAHGGVPRGLESKPREGKFTEEIADFFDRNLKK